MKLEAHSFPRATLSENCSPLGTDMYVDNIGAYFPAKWRLLLTYASISNNVKIIKATVYRDLRTKYTTEKASLTLSNTHRNKDTQQIMYAWVEKRWHHLWHCNELHTTYCLVLTTWLTKIMCEPPVKLFDWANF